MSPKTKQQVRQEAETCEWVCWSQALLQQGRHVLLHLSWICQRAVQDHAPDSTLHLRRRNDLQHMRFFFNTLFLQLIAFAAWYKKLRYLHIYFASLQKKFPLHCSPLTISQTDELLCLNQIKQKRWCGKAINHRHSFTGLWRFIWAIATK